jgi:predicted transcriptional regulator
MTEVRVRKKYNVREMEGIIEDYSSRYGSIHRLNSHVQQDRCAEFGSTDDLMIWVTLLKNIQNVNIPQGLSPGDPSFALEFSNTIAYPDFELTNFITPKRMELLKVIREKPGLSIKELAAHLDRDYKNVYDDVQALVKFELLVLQKRGKARVPVFPSDTIEIHI